MSSQKPEDYYQELSLPPVPNSSKDGREYFLHYKESELESDLRDLIRKVNCVDLQNRLQIAANRLIVDWEDRHNTLIDILNELEQHKAHLEQRLHVRENQMFHRHQQRSVQSGQVLHPFQRRRSSITQSSTASLLSSSSGRSSSCASSVYTTFSVAEELNHPSASFLSSTSTSTSTASSFSVVDPVEHHELNQDLDTYASIISDDLPSYTNRHSNISSSSNKSNYASKAIITPQLSLPLVEQDTNDAGHPDTASSSDTQLYSPPTIEHSEQALTFACGDGFWNTIAKGKSNKAEVDTLVGNYLRRGGIPDVAKNSETVKDVKEGYSLIHALVAIKNTAALQKVIDAGAKTNIYPLTSKKEDWITPLMLAVKLGYLNGTELLLRAGDASLLYDRGPSGETVLHAAIQSGSEEMISYVLKMTQYALLEKADAYGKARLASLFIRDFHCQPDPKDNKGETPLHYAVRNRKLKAITKLVGELGVCPNPYISKQVPTPLDLAKSGGLRSIADYLKSAGAKTTKEMEKLIRTTAFSAIDTSSGSSVLSGDSNASVESTASQTTIGVRHYLNTKTSQILKGTFQ
ncbi:ankyrin repeat-containing domain protein [Choanephora cucurbitarum]|nr:ankyrin repeat-containing domain protein [Choanephora cucurbitarum]